MAAALADFAADQSAADAADQQAGAAALDRIADQGAAQAADHRAGGLAAATRGGVGVGGRHDGGKGHGADGQADNNETSHVLLAGEGPSGFTTHLAPGRMRGRVG